MSYCRFAWNGSDVYVYESAEGIVCCGCFMDEKNRHFVCKTEEEMIAHLGQHRRRGDFVPLYAIEGLWEAIPGATKPERPEPEELTRGRVLLEKLAEDKLKEPPRGEGD